MFPVLPTLSLKKSNQTPCSSRLLHGSNQITTILYLKWDTLGRLKACNLGATIWVKKDRDINLQEKVHLITKVSTYQTIYGDMINTLMLLSNIYLHTCHEWNLVLPPTAYV